MEPLRPSEVGEIGRYRLMARLGSGGMGQVYLGLSSDGRLVALKQVHAILAENADFRSRFRREVNASRMVSGAYTAAVMDADTEAVLPWLASVFVPGPSLDTAMDHCRPLPLSSVRVLAAGLAAALSEIHRAGLVHRDLKPSNVLLAEDGPRVIDFGVARAAQANTEITQVGWVIGSPQYMSPEQAEGKSLTSASDVFSLGSILLLACTGKAPFGPGITPEVLYRVVHSEPDLAAVPAELRELLSACLAKQPDARPTADAVQAAIGQIDPGQSWLPAAVRALIDAQQAELRALLPLAEIPEVDIPEAETSETATVATSDTAGALAPSPSGPSGQEPESSPPVSSGVRSRRGRSAKVGRIVVALVSGAALVATGIVWASLHWFQD
ncbi:MAG: serine/threonine-protein kinase, partial [Sciscionella sp.]